MVMYVLNFSIDKLEPGRGITAIHEEGDLVEGANKGRHDCCGCDCCCEASERGRRRKEEGGRGVC
jgi:hypothetical protein